MKIVGLSGSNVGTKTRSVLDYTLEVVKGKYKDVDISLIDLAEVELVFSDGRHYEEYDGDTKEVARKIMEADVVFIGTPVFQASIPAALKNVFDLLPQNALQDKVVSIFVTAGTSKHYLMVEHQLMPILTFLKAHTVPQYVFIEEKDFYQKEIINDDILLRLDRLVEDTFRIAEAYANIRKTEELEYGL